MKSGFNIEKIASLVLAMTAVISVKLYAASCCVGGGPKSFIQLRNFEKYQVGLSLGYKDNYAKYTPYGTLAEAKKTETFVSSFGAGMRFRDDLDASLLVPYSSIDKSMGLGDASVLLRYVLVDPLYISDWYPKVSITTSLKAPTGNQDGDNGNGLWEPGIGVLLEKDYTEFLLNFSAGYTYRSQKQTKDPFTGSALDVKLGDRFELAQSVIVPLTESLSVATGSSQLWELATQLNGQSTAYSQGRSVQGFISTTYFFSRIWKMTAAFESTLPIEGWGTTLPATRAFTVTSTYSIY